MIIIAHFPLSRGRCDVPFVGDEILVFVKFYVTKTNLKSEFCTMLELKVTWSNNPVLQGAGVQGQVGAACASFTLKEVLVPW